MIDVLDSEFNDIVKSLLKNCLEKGIHMEPYEKLRSPYVQAIYWKQGRSKQEIKKTLKFLSNEKAHFLLNCIEEAKRMEGLIITNALPGCSWHQWGEAIDCCWIDGNKKIWDIQTLDSNGINGYKIYAEEAYKLGLDAGFYWEKFTDAAHVQYQSYASPLNIYTMTEVNDIMKDFYS